MLCARQSEHTPGKEPENVLGQLDILAAVFQTEIPAETAAFAKGEITAEEFEEKTSHQALEEHFEAKCKAVNCGAEYPDERSVRPKHTPLRLFHSGPSSVPAVRHNADKPQECHSGSVCMLSMGAS